MPKPDPATVPVKTGCIYPAPHAAMMAGHAPVIGTRRALDRIHYTDHDLITERDGPARRDLHRDGTPYGDAK